jgi:hypothetical protein
LKNLLTRAIAWKKKKEKEKKCYNTVYRVEKKEKKKKSTQTHLNTINYYVTNSSLFIYFKPV